MRPIIHTRREDLFSILRGLEILIAKDKQSNQDFSKLDTAKHLIEEELGLRNPEEYEKFHTLAGATFVR